MEIGKKTKRKFRKNVYKNENGCWIWRGAKDNRGSGRFYVPELKKTIPAHRLTYELVNGPVPAGHEIYHICRDRACVHPPHLKAGTREDISRFAAECGAWRGERSGRTIKKEADIMAIIILNEHLNVPVEKIVEATGIPQRTVYSYLKREAWSHLTLPSSRLDRDEFLQAYIDGDLPGEDSPYSSKIRSLLKRHFKNKKGHKRCMG